MREIHIACTGTETGMSHRQYLAAELLMCRIDTEIQGESIAHYKEPIFHHGDCIGADEEFAHIAHELGWKVVGHPSDLVHKRAHSGYTSRWLTPKPPLVRNHDMVDVGEYCLIAAPREFHEVMRSGTWATIRYARKLARKIYIVWPNGEVAENGVERERRAEK